MLSGEGNAGERWKTKIGLIRKKATLHVQACSTLFLYISLMLFCTTTTWNVQKRLSYTFYGGNVARFLVHFFFTVAHFHLNLHWWPLAFLILLPPLQNFHVVLPTKKCLLCFLSLALDLCRPFSRWASLACRLLSLFLCLSLALYSKFVDMTINLIKFPLSVFVFIGSLVVSASQDADGYALSRQNNLELHLGCHTCWLSYFTLVCLWCGRTVGRAVGRCTVTWLPNFLEWVAYHIFSPMVLRCARFARESSDITFRDCRLGIFSDNFSRNSCIHV